MKYLKLFENSKVFKFNIGDFVKITYNPKVFDNCIFEITNRITREFYKEPDRNEYELRYVYPEKFVKDRDSLVRDAWEDELRKVEDYEIDAMKYNL